MVGLVKPLEVGDKGTGPAADGLRERISEPRLRWCPGVALVYMDRMVPLIGEVGCGRGDLEGGAIPGDE